MYILIQEAAEEDQKNQSSLRDSQGNKTVFMDAQGNPIPAPPTTMHHIVPVIQIRDDVINLHKTLTSTEFEKQLEDYLNQPHIRKVLLNMTYFDTQSQTFVSQWDNSNQFLGYWKDPGSNTSQPMHETEKATQQRIFTGVGRVLQAAILNNPHNLIYGIDSKKRPDPGPNFDQTLYDKQNHDQTQLNQYQKKVNNYQNARDFNTFGAIPRPSHNYWQELSNQPGVYDAKNPNEP